MHRWGSKRKCNGSAGVERSCPERQEQECIGKAGEDGSRVVGLERSGAAGPERIGRIGAARSYIGLAGMERTGRHRSVQDWSVPQWQERRGLVRRDTESKGAAGTDGNDKEGLGWEWRGLAGQECKGTDRIGPKWTGVDLAGVDPRG